MIEKGTKEKDAWAIFLPVNDLYAMGNWIADNRDNNRVRRCCAADMDGQNRRILF